jgi:hypothetical protein
VSPTLSISSRTAGPALSVTLAPDGPVKLTCDGRLTFAPSAFTNPTGAEAADRPQAQALRDLIRAQRESGRPPFPATAWRVLVETADTVTFHHGRADSGTAFTFVRVEGQWRFRASGCSARRVIDGYAVSPIRPVSGRKPLQRDARRVVFSIELGGGCQRHDFERFVVRETRHTVTVLALLRPGPTPPPDAICPAVLFGGLEALRLQRPLGRRAIRDAAVYPVKPVARAR